MRPTASTTNANNFDAATYANATLHVPMGSLSSYSSTNPWSQFSHIVEDRRFVVDGIYYYIEDGSSVSVTYRDSGFNTYSGYVEVPSAVTYKGVTYDVVAIGDDAFRGSINLIDVSLSNSVTTIGARAFYACDQLESITLGQGVTSIGSQAFRTSKFFYIICYASEPPTIQSDTFDSSIYVNSYLFVRYPAVDAYVAAPYWNNFGAGRIFGYYDFMVGENYFCITGPNTVSVCTMAINSDWSAFYARYDYTVVSEIEIPATVTYEGVTYQVTAIDGYAFGFCEQLKKVILPEGILGIGAMAFYGCSSLQEIIFPESLTSISYGAFYRCSTLKRIDIPDNVNAIDYYAFCSCDSVQHITLGSGLEYLGYRAFYMSDNLIDVTCKAAVPPAADPDAPVMFTQEDYQNATLYVPYASLSDYQSAPGWQQFYTMVPTYTLDDALNVAGGNIHFESTGEYPWEVIIDGGGNWVYARSGNTGVQSSASEVTATVDVPIESILSFTYQAWGEGTADNLYDKCIFLIDGIEQFCYGARQNDWEGYAVYLQPGTHTLSWKYTKDSTVNPVGDYFSLNDVAITPTIMRGDVDGNGIVGITDVTTLIDYLLNGDASDLNLGAADCNLDGHVSIADVTDLIDFILNGIWN